MDEWTRLVTMEVMDFSQDLPISAPTSIPHLKKESIQTDAQDNGQTSLLPMTMPLQENELEEHRDVDGRHKKPETASQMYILKTNDKSKYRRGVELHPVALFLSNVALSGDESFDTGPEDDECESENDGSITIKQELQDINITEQESENISDEAINGVFPREEHQEREGIEGDIAKQTIDRFERSKTTSENKTTTVSDIRSNEFEKHKIATGNKSTKISHIRSKKVEQAKNPQTKSIRITHLRPKTAEQSGNPAKISWGKNAKHGFNMLDPSKKSSLRKSNRLSQQRSNNFEKPNPENQITTKRNNQPRAEKFDQSKKSPHVRPKKSPTLKSINLGKTQNAPQEDTTKKKLKYNLAERKKKKVPTATLR